jgi:hypothetical protein
MSERELEQGPPASPPSVRLVIAYQGRELRLLMRQEVNVLAPPSDSLVPHPDQGGFWAELRDPAGRPLHRLLLADPFAEGVEVFSNEPGRTIRRVPEGERRGSFSLLVPDLLEGDHLALMGPVTTEGFRAPGSGPTTELARFALHDDPSRGQA